MNPAAPPASPEAHARVGGPGLRGAIAVAVRGGIVAFALVWLAAQIAPAMIEGFGGGLALPTALKLGWLYELAIHHVGIDVTAIGVEIGRLFVTFLLGTGLALWLLFRAGRAAARCAGPSLRDRVLAGAAVGPAYALPIALITSLVRLQLATGGGLLPDTVRFQGVVWQAFVFPALLGIAAGGAGGALTSIRSGSRAHAWLVGGWRMLLGSLGLAVIGVLLLAAVRPQGLATYTHSLTARGSRVALLLLGHHALLLPNQSFLVLAPSLGGCTALMGPKAIVPLVCPGRLPALDAATVLEDIARVRGASVHGSSSSSMPPGYWLFLLVPALATLGGGRWAGRTGPGSLGLGERLLRGAGAGVVFAVLVGAGTWMANLELGIDVPGGSSSTSLTLGARVVPTALLALAWGVAGGALGASIRRRQDGTPEPDELDEPVPPNPTSV